MSTMEETFHCDAFKLDMPVDKQRGFCAIQFRKGRDICLECERGKTAAEETRDEVRNGLPQKDNSARVRAGVQIQAKLKEDDVAEKKLCTKGCGKGAVKDGFCTKHYREQFGEAPFPSGNKPPKAGRQAGRANDLVGKKTGSRAGAKKHSHTEDECEGCKALQLQIDDLNLAEKIMVAAGLCPAEKFEQARKIVRELHG